MAKKHYSFIIVPHHKGQSKKISLTEKRVKILAGVLSFICILFIVFLVDYFTMNVTRQKYRALSDENARQKETIAQYKLAVNRLRKNIDDFEEYAKKINVWAGLQSPEVLRELGVGSGARDDDQQANISNPTVDPGLKSAESISQKAQGIDRNLDTLAKFFEDKAYQMATSPSINPTAGWTTSSFGKRKDPFTGEEEFHYGIDIAASLGSPIYATADGYVHKIKEEKTGGKVIILNHGGGVTTVYCHMSKFNVKVGQKVKRRDVIGFVGQTGKAIGPHVHYEVRKNGRAVNPWNYILDE
ncbi:MAG: peptidoglycan DD-metalloendopeptidase family protein [Candidatus Aminicenantes bacterium]|nr:MAG: peptidoglycan DD-metalloendopeptidase family protein [Candidatus Aminicenantes bacterium]